MHGIDQVGVLADAGPAQIPGFRLGNVVAAGQGGNAVYGEGGAESHFFRFLGHFVLAQLHSQLGKHDITGLGHAFFKSNLTVARHTSDLFAVHLNFPAAGEDPFIDVGNIVNGRGAGDNFKSGAWRHRGGKHLVEKYAVVLAGFVVFNVGAVFRVVGGRADHAEDFPGDIVGNHHSAVPVPHQGKSLGAQAAVQRQGQVVPGAESGVGADAGNKIIADQIRTAGILYRRGNGPGVVSDGLEHGLADEGIGAVNPLAV